MLALLATGALSKNQTGGMSRQKGRQGHQAIDCIYRGKPEGCFTPPTTCACKVHLEASVETYVKIEVFYNLDLSCLHTSRHWYS